MRYQSASQFVEDETIRNVLGPKTRLESILFAAGLWPSMGPETLLRRLSLLFRQKLNQGWKVALMRFAEGLATRQRTMRLAVLTADRQAQEMNHLGVEGWSALGYPDWCLVQLDANMLIRPVQASIAKEMMFPADEASPVMQLNMGEGKSSVIVPIISVALADGGQLVLMIVL